MKTFFTWLEGENSRLRKVLAITITLVWIISTVIAFIFKDTMSVYAIVTAQFISVVGFYMSTKPNKGD